MGRKSQEIELTAAVKEYLRMAELSQLDARLLNVKSVTAALGVSRTSIYKYGLDELIREAQQKQISDGHAKPHKLNDLLANLRQELKQSKIRSKALLAQLNLVEANAARLGIDPEELYRPLVKPIRVLPQVDHSRRSV